MATAPHIEEISDRDWMRLREQAVRRLRANDGQHGYEFRCENPIEAWRVKSMASKESGTVAWIGREARPGDVFYDVGANMGLYTLMAARRVVPGGKVYAFEPHAGSLQSLLHNVALNQLAGVVEVIGSALHDREGFFPFNYHEPIAGSSMSQLGDTRDDHNRPFRPVFSELKHGVPADRLIEWGAIRPATLVKLDVDGNELLVLRGMRRLLSSAAPPRWLQVEVSTRHKAELFALLDELGYELRERHYTSQGKQELAAGADPESIPYNGLFRPRSATTN